MNRLAPHIGDRIIEAVVSQVDAGDLRGSKAVQDKVQAELMREIERIAGDLALMVRAISLRWEVNPEEIEAISRREIERDQERQDFAFSVLEREMVRADQTTRLKLASELDIEKIEAASEDELRNLVLGQELQFIDARDVGVRVQEIKAFEHEVAKLKQERLAKFEAVIDNARNEIEAEELRAQFVVIRQRTEKLEAEHRDHLVRLERIRTRELNTDDKKAEIEIADLAHGSQLKTLSGLQNVKNAGARGEVEIDNLAKDAEHRRRQEEQKSLAQAENEKLKTLVGSSPEMVLAINAGLSPDVAQILIEKARAETSDNVTGFGCRPHVDGCHGHRGRRPKAAREGRRGWLCTLSGSMGISLALLVRQALCQVS